MENEVAQNCPGVVLLLNLRSHKNVFGSALLSKIQKLRSHKMCARLLALEIEVSQTCAGVVSRFSLKSQ